MGITQYLDHLSGGFVVRVIGISFFILLQAFFAVTAQAQTSENEPESSVASAETVIRDNAFNSTSRIVLDEAAIRKSKAPNVTTLLSTQANIVVSNSSIQPGSIFLRGGDSSHILILMDGLPFYDASTVQRTLNLNEIDIKSIRRIEVIKGSQSVLYGGQALTGVIKIDTFPQDTESRSMAAVEAGRRDYSKVSVFGLKSLGDEDAVLARAQSSGKDARSPVLDSKETYWGRLHSGELGYLHRGTWDSFFKLGEINDENEITNSDPVTYKAVDASGFVASVDIKSLMGGVVGKNHPVKPKILLGYQVSDRSFIQRPMADWKYASSLLNVRGEATPVDEDKLTVFTGVSYSKETFVFRDSDVEQANAFNEQKGIFGKLNWYLQPRVVFELGLRSDFYKKSDHIESYQAGISFFDMLKLEYSTGFKAPSLFQLYSTYGNVDLLPEKAQTYTLSFEEQVGDQQSLSFSLFETHFNNLITTQGAYPALKYYNVSRAVTKGGEVQYSYQTLSMLKADFSVGYQEPWDVDAARWLLRRPLKTASVRLTKSWEKYDVGYEVTAIGDRLDRISTAEYGSLDSYMVSNVFASQQINDQQSIYLRGSNIFSQRFEESSGYFNEGAFWLVGYEIKN
jgi:iron complex outermembrane receptor protein/vitamin B12 transporter